jgi:hypothetical protein
MASYLRTVLRRGILAITTPPWTLLFKYTLRGQFIRYITRSQIFCIPTDSESRSHGLLCKVGRQASKHSVTLQLNVRMGKTGDLSDFERGMIVCARRAGYSIPETDGLLGLTRTTVSRVH